MRFVVLGLNVSSRSTAGSAFAELDAIRKTLGLQRFTTRNLVAEKAPGRSKAPLDRIPKSAVVLVGGAPSVSQLRDAVATLTGRGNHVIVVTNALDNLDQLRDTLIYLDDNNVQMTVTGAVPTLVRQPRLALYAYPKADDTTTTCVILDADTDDPQVLIIIRGHAPYQGLESLPGGFLRVHLESLDECAVREVLEECFAAPGNQPGQPRRFTLSIDPAQLILVDVRSRTGRDERGHVIDHGYMWLVPASRRQEVIDAVSAGDDAAAGSARFVPLRELLERDMAFDHIELARAVWNRLHMWCDFC